MRKLFRIFYIIVSWELKNIQRKITIVISCQWILGRVMQKPYIKALSFILIVQIIPFFKHLIFSLNFLYLLFFQVNALWKKLTQLNQNIEWHSLTIVKGHNNYLDIAPNWVIHLGNILAEIYQPYFSNNQN